jgi:hypothetical protein
MRQQNIEWCTHQIIAGALVTTLHSVTGNGVGQWDWQWLSIVDQAYPVAKERGFC